MRGVRAVELPPTRRLGPIARASLVFEILAAYRRARRLMHDVDLATAVAELRATGPRGPAPDATARGEVVLGRRLGRAVMLVLACLPTDKRCLIRSLTLSALLAHRGIPAHLIIGVKPRSTEAFVAHAWVEVADLPVLPVEGYEQLHRL